MFPSAHKSVNMGCSAHMCAGRCIHMCSFFPGNLYGLTESRRRGPAGDIAISRGSMDISGREAHCTAVRCTRTHFIGGQATAYTGQARG